MTKPVRASLLSAGILRPALRASLVKLDPRVQLRNPVMFVVEIGAALTTVIAIVDGDPTPDEEREHHLDLLIYRPIVADEARAVLAKARKQMQSHSSSFEADGAAVLDRPDMAEPSAHQSEDPNLVSIASELPETLPSPAFENHSEESSAFERNERNSLSPLTIFRAALAVALLLAAGFFFWTSRDTFRYLSQSPEGAMHVLKDSVASFLYVNKSGTQSLTTAVNDAQQDAYFARTSAPATSQSHVGVVSADIEIPDRDIGGIHEPDA